MHAFGIYRVFFSLGFQRKGELNQGPTYVDQPGDMPLDGCTAKEEVDLVVVVACRGRLAHFSHSYRCHLDGKGTGMKGEKGRQREHPP